jgi:hypothetical protein
MTRMSCEGSGFGALYGAFLKESRTSGHVEWSVQEIRDGAFAANA